MKYMPAAGALLAGASMLAACTDDNYKMKYPPRYELPELPVVEGVHSFKAPMYWSVYEYC